MNVHVTFVHCGLYDSLLNYEKSRAPHRQAEMIAHYSHKCPQDEIMQMSFILSWVPFFTYEEKKMCF